MTFPSRMRSAFSLPILAALMLTAVGLAPAHAADRLKPFELAYTTQGDLAQTVSQVQQKLTAAGFQIVGSYKPYTDAKFTDGETVSAEVIGVTNAALQAAATQTSDGGYAAVQRVTVTQVTSPKGSEIQVAYTNPSYMAAAYRLKSDLGDVTTALGKALGTQEAYGSRDGLSVSDLHGYHYKIFMPYFDDQTTLASYDSHAQAVSAVAAGLAAHAGGTSKVYEVSLPGGQQTLFGVGLAGTADNACGSDRYIMNRIDFAATKSTGHLPYEILVIGDKVKMLPAKFRIAINFPDLSMMGSHSFLSIMCAPDSIEKALKAAAKGAPAETPAAAASAH